MNNQPIPNLTDEQVLALSYRSDLPRDIHNQVTASLHAMQIKYDYEKVIKEVSKQKLDK